MKRAALLVLSLTVLPGGVCANVAEPCPKNGPCFEPGDQGSGTLLGPNGTILGPADVAFSIDAGADDAADAGTGGGGS